MKIGFETRKLQKTFNSEKELNREYGPEMAKKIKLRMAVLEASENLADVPTLPPDRCHELTQNRKGQFAVDLRHPYRLLLRPNHDPLPRKTDGGLDLKKITDITILGVEDYH